MAKILSYEEKDTWIHRLSGATKLIFFLLWCLTSMLTYDTRVLLVMVIFSLIVFKISQTQWKQVGSVFKVIMVFLVFYEFNVVIKYFTIIPAVFMFLVTTNPSEFAASMNKIGISYNVGYAVSIALRYIPDVQGEFTKIRNAQEARGIEMSGKASLMSRIKNTSSIIFPLIFSSMDRIDVVSNAMELRGYGKHKKRTWYMERALKRNDYLVIGFTVLFMVVALAVTFADGSRFYNPFV